MAAWTAVARLLWLADGAKAAADATKQEKKAAFMVSDSVAISGRKQFALVVKKEKQATYQENRHRTRASNLLEAP
jgi:hypothetical protein